MASGTRTWCGFACIVAPAARVALDRCEIVSTREKRTCGLAMIAGRAMHQPTADFDLAENCTLLARPVAVMRCAQRVHHEAPRQARTRTTDADNTPHGAIVVRQGLQNLLQDLDGFTHVWLLFWCHLSRGYNDLVTPPRDTRKRGLFATRAPDRPNPVGMSAVRLLRIEKRVLHVGAHDLLDGTPILDIKPYVAAYDAIADAGAGWVDTLADDRPDHRAWWRDKGEPPPQVYRERGLQ